MPGSDELERSYEVIVAGLAGVPEPDRYAFLTRLVLLAAERIGSADVVTELATRAARAGLDAGVGR